MDVHSFFRDFGISTPHVRSLSLEAGIEGSRGMLLLSDDNDDDDEDDDDDDDDDDDGHDDDDE